jgi:hypothetical protein
VNPDSQDIDGLPFIDALQKTAAAKWSGILRVTKEAEQIGSVFMRDGNVAWAVSKNQTENFSSFLERIGLIPKEKLNEIVRKYKALGKAKKLGELLEEEGLISHEKLRECLGAHIRAAIKSLMDDPLVIIEASNGEMIVDANLMFDLQELLSENQQVNDENPEIATAPSPTVSDNTDNNRSICDILETLSSLPGYRFSFVSGMEGKLPPLHKSDSDPDPEATVVSATEWINSSARNCANGMLGKMESLILEHENGLLVAQMIDGERLYFVTGAFGKEGKPGVVKHKIAELIPSIRKFM